MRAQVYIEVNFSEGYGRGYRTHVITLNNKAAIERLVEYIQGPALDEAGIGMDDCEVYDDQLDSLP